MLIQPKTNGKIYSRGLKNSPVGMTRQENARRELTHIELRIPPSDATPVCYIPSPKRVFGEELSLIFLHAHLFRVGINAEVR